MQFCAYGFADGNEMQSAIRGTEDIFQNTVNDVFHMYQRLEIIWYRSATSHIPSEK